MPAQSHRQQVDALLPVVQEYFLTHQAHVPTLNAQAQRILALGARIFDISRADLVALVSADPASAAAILRTSNSAQFRGRGTVNGLDEAVVRLGRREVYAILTAIASKSLFEPKLQAVTALLPQHWYRLQLHSVVSAFASSWLCTKLGFGSYEEVFLAGMFHDIGKLGALYSLASLLLREEIDFDVSLQAAAEVLEELHVQMGVRMLSNWSVQGLALQACQLHHGGISPRIPNAQSLHAVRVVSCLDILRDNVFVPPELQSELRDSLAALNIDAEGLKALAPTLQLITDRAAELLGRPKPADT